MNNALWILLGGAIGAPLRYITDRLVSRLHTHDWPWGTFVVNVTGAFFFASLVTAKPTFAAFPAAVFLGAGLLGAFTTWSTFTVEVVRLMQVGQWRNAISYVTASLVGGVAAAYAGYLVWLS